MLAPCLLVGLTLVVLRLSRLGHAGAIAA
jgi:hypothetical protein